MAKMLFIVDAEYNENIGIMCLSSYLKANGHHVNLALLSHYKRVEELLSYVNDVNPDLVGFSVMTPQADDYETVAEVIKRRTQKKIIWGGPHCTFMPEVVSTIDHIDFIGVGEAEDSLLSLMNRIEANEDYSDIPGIWVRKDKEVWVQNEVGRLEQDLDKYPYPDRDLFYDISPVLKFFNPKVVITQRGCPYKCAFCCEPLMKKVYEGKGKLVRRHSPEYVVGELKEIIRKYPTRNVHFRDDTFNVNKVQELLEEYRKNINLPFTCNIAGNNVSEKLIIQLKDAGCTGVYFAFESGVERIRFDVLQKTVTNEQYLKIAGWLHKHKLDFITSMLFGLPTETLDDAIESIRFNNLLRPLGTRESFLKLFKGTPLAEYALSRKLCTPASKYLYKVKDVKEEHQYIRKIPMKQFGFIFLKFRFLTRFANSILRSNVDQTLTLFNLPLKLFCYYSEKSFFKMSIWNIWMWKYLMVTRQHLFKKPWEEKISGIDFTAETEQGEKVPGIQSDFVNAIGMGEATVNQGLLAFAARSRQTSKNKRKST